MRLITDEAYAQIVEALKLAERTSYSETNQDKFIAAITVLQALPEVEVAAYASYGEQINKPLYATKEPK